MITGVGTDLIEIARVQKAIGRSAFLERVYTEKERELIAVRSVRAASNFAGKEAVAKALGCGFAGIAPKEIEILRYPSGMPYVVLHGRAKEKAKEQGISDIFISLSDTKELVQAYAVCEAGDAGFGESGMNPAGAQSGERKTFSETACPVLDAAGMKETDRRTIEEYGIPSLELMERAATAVAECVKEYATKEDRIGVLCGTGNNGGDGVAVARLLKKEGFDVTVLVTNALRYSLVNGQEEGTVTADSVERISGTPEFFYQIKEALRYGVPVCEPEKTDCYDIIVDALFGIGLSKPLEGAYAAYAEQINSELHRVIAVDIPSGVNATTGGVCGVALRADETVTFGAAKCGHLLYPGKEYTGKLRIAKIGFPEVLLQEYKRGDYLKPSGVGSILPKRPAYSNKGTFGKVAVLAGSKNMVGAAYFAACGAYRTGAGLVKVVTPECNREVLQTLLPEAMLSTYGEAETVSDAVTDAVRFADAIVVGPGLGQSSVAESLLDSLQNALTGMGAEAPVSVWDADALNLIAKRMQADRLRTEQERIGFLNRWLPQNAIITPHPGELSRLLGGAVQELTKELPAVAKRLSAHGTVTCVLKDAVTVVARAGSCFFNTTGNNGMATGGSGDILCGIIGALTAAGLDCFTAAATGVWLHGAAGDAAARNMGEAPMIARDMLEAIGKLFSEKGKEVVE